MKHKPLTIVYWTATGLLAATMVYSAGMYLLNPTEVGEVFTSLGYPSYLVTPLAILKLLGVIAILTRKSVVLAEWAYAGFFYDMVLALAAHLTVGDDEAFPAVLGIAFLIVSYLTARKLRFTCGNPMAASDPQVATRT